MHSADEEIRIEKNIPIPPKRSLGGTKRASKYPFERLQPRESVFYPYRKAGVSPKVLQQRVYAAMGRVRRMKPGWSFVIRTYDDGIRVWRTE